MLTKHDAKVFDYKALRLLVGLIAFALPFVVSFQSSISLSSISASYYSDARDAFVGMLFIVGAFLWAYNGHGSRDAYISCVGSVAAVLVALFPTACDTCDVDAKAIVHYSAAFALFLTLIYFCFFSFRKHTKGEKGKKGLRSKIYWLCGWAMIAAVLGVIVAKLLLPDETVKALGIVYWAEAIALCAFGISWIVAGKYIGLVADKSEALSLFGK